MLAAAAVTGAAAVTAEMTAAVTAEVTAAATARAAGKWSLPHRCLPNLAQVHLTAGIKFSLAAPAAKVSGNCSF